ncbi:hypothetical protein QE152_g21692 [Popillia japonica]|uniref:Reverse transcriptase n=1 Tax=Popillia japonica TaxID=7064 RepID=A0AAW1KKX2_POPJA
MASAKVNNILAKGCSQSWGEKKVLLESIVKSVVFYAAEIWGVNYVDKLETTQLRFLKGLLKCSRSTPNSMLRTETGTDHICSQIIKRALTWLHKATIWKIIDFLG